MASFFARIQEECDLIKSCGADIPEEDKLLVAIKALRKVDEYKGFVSLINIASVRTEYNSFMEACRSTQRCAKWAQW